MHPSSYPSSAPTGSPSSSPTEYIEPLASIVQRRTETWETYGYYLIFLCIIGATIGVINSFVFEKCIKKGADGHNVVATLRFFSNIADFGSDVLLSVVFLIIYQEAGNDYFWFFTLSLTFTVVPYLLSCTVGIISIERWRNDIDGQMLEYLKRYDILLISITIISGFLFSC